MLEKGPNGFNAKLRKALTDAGAFVTQIESETGRGTPDFHYVKRGPRWVECKVSATATLTHVALRPDQIVWHTRNYQAGGAPSYVAVYQNRTGHVFIFDGKYARIISGLGGANEVPSYEFLSITAAANWLLEVA